jgi:alpha-amylase/alpha-mannosidase (GH57 family)
MSKDAPHYVCIHGHFYQPYRENPWLEYIEREESAYPFPNWNERILAECYRPNAASRIVDGKGRIVRIANNYSKMSCNFGPTLLAWLEQHATDVYQAIIEADRLSQSWFSGHGSLIAQAHTHMIMPLANRRDKITQIQWGIRDFQRRFGRRPEGMWLPETAVDYETLDLMAEHGVLFTILAPKQARRIRALGSGDWVDVSGARIDPGRTYRATTPSGRHIDIFFYDGPASNAVAFERLLHDGRRFAERLAAYGPRNGPTLSHIATDGETYGHHHRHGDMALAYALHHIEENRPERLTVYGEFRELHPAEWEVEIIDNTAWSCAHGVGRWSDDCGCQSGGHPEWNQRWRKPLRQALDWLRDQLATLFEVRGGQLLRDPWQARNNYIDVINDRSAGNVDCFLREHAARVLEADEECAALQLLEMQRQAMLMYTSCGWFFDDLTGIETLRILQSAARAIELAGASAASELEGGFLDILDQAQSNRPGLGKGREIYCKLVLPARIDLSRMIAHYAVSSLFDDHRGRTKVYRYQIEALDLHLHEAGKARLSVGTVRCTSTITRASSTMSFGALHFGDHNLTGGVRQFTGEDDYRLMREQVIESFDRADLVTTQRRLDQHFLELTFSLKTLLPDYQQRVLDRILQVPLDDAEAAYSQLYAHHAPLMRFLVSLDLPIPLAFETAAQFILQLRLRRVLQEEVVAVREARAYLEQARLVGVDIADVGTDYLWRQNLDRLATSLASTPDDLASLDTLTAIAELITEQGYDVELWHTQNECYKLLQSEWPVKKRQAYDGNADAERWLDLFKRLCEAMRIAL